MNAAVQHYQLRLALQDIQTLDEIAVRIEEGASSDVMEILAQNVGSINERQGIDMPPMDVLSAEAYKERAQIALEGITASLSRIWNAIYTSIGNLVTGIKRRWLDSVGLYENRIKELSEVLEGLKKLDQKAQFDLSVSDKQALRLCDDKGNFKMADAPNNLKKFSEFLDELAIAVTSSGRKLDDILSKEIGKASVTENPLTAEALPLVTASKLASLSSKESFSYSFGGKLVTVRTPDGLDVSVNDLPNVSIQYTEQNFPTVKSMDKTATVGDAVKMVEACIQVLRNNIVKDADWEKLVKALEELNKVSQKYRATPQMALVTSALTGMSSAAAFTAFFGIGAIVLAGTSPLVILSSVAASAAYGATAGVLGTAAGMATDSKLVGGVVSLAFSVGDWGAMYGAVKGAMEGIDERRGEGKLSQEDDKFITTVQREYTRSVKILTGGLNECIALSEDIMNIRESVLDDAVIALTRIARNALKAGTPA